MAVEVPKESRERLCFSGWAGAADRTDSRTRAGHPVVGGRCRSLTGWDEHLGDRHDDIGRSAGCLRSTARGCGMAVGEAVWPGMLADVGSI